MERRRAVALGQLASRRAAGDLEVDVAVPKGAPEPDRNASPDGRLADCHAANQYDMRRPRDHVRCLCRRMTVLPGIDRIWTRSQSWLAIHSPRPPMSVG